MCNLRAEGYLTAKHLFPGEFAPYELDERRYLIDTMKELRGREAHGVDVTDDVEELRSYVARAHPDLLEHIDRDREALLQARQSGWWQRLRGAIGDLGPRKVRDRLDEGRLARAKAAKGLEMVRRGDVRSGLHVRGADVGFRDIVQCADFLQRIVSEPMIQRRTVPPGNRPLDVASRPA
jgi:hypothetical protein